MFGLLFAAGDAASRIGGHLMTEFSKSLATALVSTAGEQVSAAAKGFLAGAAGERLPNLANTILQGTSAGSVDGAGLQLAIDTAMRATGVALVGVDELNALRAVAEAAAAGRDTTEALDRLRAALAAADSKAGSTV